LVADFGPRQHRMQTGREGKPPVEEAAAGFVVPETSEPSPPAAPASGDLLPNGFLPSHVLIHLSVEMLRKPLVIAQ